MIGLLIGVLAAAPCTRVVITPFEPLATSPTVARALEEQVRGALAARPGLCVEARAATIEKLAKFERHRLPPCGEPTCVAAQLSAMGADELVSGVVVGAGGRTNVDLARSTATRSARTTATEAELATAVGVLYQWDSSERAGPKRWPSIVLGSTAVASAGVGLGLGLMSRSTEGLLSSGMTGCGGMGTAYRDCLDGQLRSGRNEATAANVLFGIAGALLAGAVILWVVELP